MMKWMVSCFQILLIFLDFWTYRKWQRTSESFDFILFATCHVIKLRSKRPFRNIHLAWKHKENLKKIAPRRNTLLGDFSAKWCMSIHALQQTSKVLIGAVWFLGNVCLTERGIRRRLCSNWGLWKSNTRTDLNGWCWKRVTEFRTISIKFALCSAANRKYQLYNWGKLQKMQIWPQDISFTFQGEHF